MAQEAAAVDGEGSGREGDIWWDFHYASSCGLILGYCRTDNDEERLTYGMFIMGMFTLLSHPAPALERARRDLVGHSRSRVSGPRMCRDRWAVPWQ